MWKKIENYFLSFSQSEVNCYELCVTDFVSIWSATYSEKAFIAQLKKSNEGLLLESEKEYVDNGLHLLNNGIDTLRHSKLEPEENGHSLLLILRTVMEYPFSFECKLSKGSNEFFFKKVTQPLLETISDLKSSEHDLLQIITKKDKEINAYKRELENKKIIFRHEVTKEFSNANHKKIYRMYDKMFGSQSLKSIKLPTKSLVSDMPNIKQEPDSIKQEPDNIKYDPDSIKEEPPNITQEPNSIKEEPQNITQEPNSIKEESIKIKQEPCTPVFENHDAPLITQPSSNRQDIVKPEASQTRTNDRRKRLKLKY